GTPRKERRANPEAIRRHLFPGFAPAVLQGNPDRPNMGLRVLPVINKDAAIRQIFADTREVPCGTPELPMWTPGAVMPRPAIVFCSSREGCQELALRLHDDHPGKVRFYHAGLEREEKDAIESWFFNSGNGILCSTTAYGMGVDKKNIRSVIHRDPAQSIESYLQEAGRAGRDQHASQAVLLITPGDIASPERQSDGFQRGRLQQLIWWVLEPGCRRAALLRRMGAEETACFGCSSCVSDPPPAPDTYWDRQRRWLQGVCRNEGIHRHAGSEIVRWTAQEYEWNSFSPPPKWIRRLPRMPEWSEAETMAAVQEVRDNPQAVRLFVRRLLQQQ
ncbi:MAG: helicase-related protein, partial [Spirochaeta sp.]